MDNASILAQILKDKPEFQILSQDKLYQAIRDNTDHRITHKTIKEYFKNRELTQIYKKPTNNYKYKITGPPRSFQLDVILLPDFKGTISFNTLRGVDRDESSGIMEYTNF